MSELKIEVIKLPYKCERCYQYFSEHKPLKLCDKCQEVLKEYYPEKYEEARLENIRLWDLNYGQHNNSNK